MNRKKKKIRCRKWEATDKSRPSSIIADGAQVLTRNQITFFVCVCAQCATAAPGARMTLSLSHGIFCWSLPWFKVTAVLLQVAMCSLWFVYLFWFYETRRPIAARIGLPFLWYRFPSSFSVTFFGAQTVTWEESVTWRTTLWPSLDPLTFNFRPDRITSITTVPS